MDKYVNSAVTAAVFFLLLGILVVPNFEDTQGDLEDGLQSVTSESNWNSVVDPDNSTDYTINSDGTVTIQNSTGIVQTEIYDSGSQDRVEVYSEQSQGTTDVTIYDDAGTQLGTTTLSGDANDTINVDPYDVEKYYLEFDSTDSTTDTTLETYESTGFRAVDDDVQVIIYLVLLLFLIAVAMGMYQKYSKA